MSGGVYCISLKQNVGLWIFLGGGLNLCPYHGEMIMLREGLPPNKYLGYF